MATKTKSITTEFSILEAAAARRNGNVLPLLDELDPATPKARKLLKAMLTAGSIEEHRTTSAAATWQVDETGKRLMLRITEQGREILAGAAQPDAAVPSDDAAVPPLTAVADAAPVPGGKLGQVLSAVQSGQGASIGDLIALTGWQPHTVRASLSRLRQSGVPIQLEGEAGQKRYVATQAEATAGR